MSRFPFSAATGTDLPAAIHPFLCSPQGFPYPPFSLPFHQGWGRRMKAHILPRIHVEWCHLRRTCRLLKDPGHKSLCPLTWPQTQSWPTHKYLHESTLQSEKQDACLECRCRWGSHVREKSNTYRSPLNHPKWTSMETAVATQCRHTWGGQSSQGLLGQHLLHVLRKRDMQKQCYESEEENQEQALSPKPGSNVSDQTRNRKIKGPTWGEEWIRKLLLENVI